MAQTPTGPKSRTELKAYFETGDKPTQAQFADLINNLAHTTEDKATDAQAQVGTDNAKFITSRTARKAIDSYVKVNDKALTNGQVTIEVADISDLGSTLEGINSAIGDKQDLLVSGTNIRTINGNTLLGNTDLVITGGISTMNNFNLSSYVKVISNTATYSTIGNPLTATGTRTANNVAVTNFYTIIPKVETLIPTAATNAVAGERQSSKDFFIKNALRGNYISFICGIATGATTITKRGFWGLRGANAVPTDIIPNTILDCIGVSFSNASSNIQIQHNDGTVGELATLVDTGLAVPITDRAELFKVEITALKGITTNPVVKITRLSDGVSFTHTITSANIPSSSTSLCFNSHCSVGGTLSVIGFGLCELESKIIY